MILPIALLLTQAAAQPDPAQQAQFVQCMEAAQADAQAAVETANDWMAAGGGLPARMCLATALSLSGRAQAALTAFEDGARLGDQTSPRAGAPFWAMAGTAALTLRQYDVARAHLDTAIARGTLSPSILGVALSDRARVRVATEDLPGARSDFDAALTAAPQDGSIWLLSATLARRMQDFARAQADIQQAAALTPRDPAVALEAGNIAWLTGNDAAARRSWESAIAIAPQSAAAVTARERIAQLEQESSPDTVQPTATRLPEPPR